MLDGSHFFECICGADEHTLKFVLSMEEDYPEIYTTIFLNQYRSFWKRLWVGIKYIFGYKCKYGHWDVWVLNPGDAERLKGILDLFIAKTKIDNNLKGDLYEKSKM